MQYGIRVESAHLGIFAYLTLALAGMAAFGSAEAAQYAWFLGMSVAGGTLAAKQIGSARKRKQEAEKRAIRQLSVQLGSFLAPRLRSFQRIEASWHHPSRLSKEEWHERLAEIVEGMEIMGSIEGCLKSAEDEKKVRRAGTLLGEHILDFY